MGNIGADIAVELTAQISALFDIRLLLRLYVRPTYDKGIGTGLENWLVS